MYNLYNINIILNYLCLTSNITWKYIYNNVLRIKYLYFNYMIMHEKIILIKRYLYKYFSFYVENLIRYHIQITQPKLYSELFMSIITMNKKSIFRNILEKKL